MLMLWLLQHSLKFFRWESALWNRLYLGRRQKKNSKNAWQDQLVWMKQYQYIIRITVHANDRDQYRWTFRIQHTHTHSYNVTDSSMYAHYHHTTTTCAVYYITFFFLSSLLLLFLSFVFAYSYVFVYVHTSILYTLLEWWSHNDHCCCVYCYLTRQRSMPKWWNVTYTQKGTHQFHLNYY